MGIYECEKLIFKRIVEVKGSFIASVEFVSTIITWSTYDDDFYEDSIRLMKKLLMKYYLTE